MGPKKKRPAKGKQPTSKEPEIDPKEVVTELQKEFFEFQLADIEKKINRIGEREEELTAETSELEEKTAEFKKEKGAVVSEYEQILAQKEEEKSRKREELIFLSEEIKIRIQKHKEHIEELDQKFTRMVTELTEQLEQLEEEVRILEDFKQNKDLYTEKLEELEEQMNQAEMQHQRNLFGIEVKGEKAKGKLKKELQSRLLQLSIEFRQKNQKKIGNPCHRMTQENKAIQTALLQMKEEVLEYQEKYKKSKETMEKFKSHKDRKLEEKNKMIARTVIQVYVIKNLMKNRLELLETLKTFLAVDLLNKNLLRKLAAVTNDVEKKSDMIEEVKQNVDDKIEETNVAKEATRHLRKTSRRLLVLIRNVLKIAEEAIAVRLIPMGGMEEERFLTNEAKIRIFKKRRDATFNRRGRILKYLFEFLSKAQLSESEQKLLKASFESADTEEINFESIYGKTIMGEREPEGIEILPREQQEEEQKGPVFYTSLTSLPRSISALVVQTQKRESEAESYEDEFEEDGEGYEEEEDRKEVTKGVEGVEEVKEAEKTAEKEEFGDLKESKSKKSAGD